MGISKTCDKKAHYTKKIKFSIKDFFSKFNQMHKKMWILSYSLKNVQ